MISDKGTNSNIVKTAKGLPPPSLLIYPLLYSKLYFIRYMRVEYENSLKQKSRIIYKCFVTQKGVKEMKKVLFGAILLALTVPIPAMAQVSVQIGVSLPPPIVFAAPPETILLPSTGVYVVPDLPVDLYFFGGWWWRPWQGHWYRSRDYRSGWAYYTGVPIFYERVHPRWREEYREHRWNGHEWHYQRLSHAQLQQIWGRQVRKQPRPQYRTEPQHGGPQRTQPVRLQSQPRPQQVRPQQQRPASQHSRSQHGGPEGRR